MKLLARIREFFTQREAEAAAKRRSPEVDVFLRKAIGAARVRASVADAHPGANESAVAGELYDDAIMLLALANEAYESGEAPTPIDRERAQIALQAWHERRGTPMVIREPWRDLGSMQPDATLRLADNDRQALLFRQLARGIDPRTAIGVRFTRYARFSALAVIAIYLVWRGGEWALREPNIALQSRVTASSHHPGTPDPRNLANGKIESDFGAHTQKEVDPWIVVDLGRERALKQVRIYPRGDGYANESLPLTFDTSRDGKAYTYAAFRPEPFSQRSPWIVDVPVTARYLRVRMQGNGYIALAEIEAYGR